MENVLFQNKNFVWIDSQTKNIDNIKNHLDRFSINRLVIDDAMEPGHLPKFEHHNDYDFALIRFFKKPRHSYPNIIREFSSKIAFYIGENFLLTIHQEKIPFFEDVLNRIDKEDLKNSLIPQDLFAMIFKENTHTFFSPAESISESIDTYEEFLFADNSSKIDLKKVYRLKRKASSCSKILMLNREVLNHYKPYYKDSTVFKDLEDYNSLLYQMHSQNNEDLKNLFELTTSMTDMRANRVMKILTIFAAFFLPLTFISGLYGMNFKNMPELEWENGYFIALGVMAAIVIGIFIWFKKEKFF